VGKLAVKKSRAPLSRNRSSSSPENDRVAARAAAERVRQMRKGVMLRGLRIKDLIAEGRR
jgi:hypothetical protein